MQTVLDLMLIKNENKQIRNIFLVDEAVHSMVELEKQVAELRIKLLGVQFISVNQVLPIMQAQNIQVQVDLPVFKVHRLDNQRMVFIQL